MNARSRPVAAGESPTNDQIECFKAAARELETNDDADRFHERVGIC